VKLLDSPKSQDVTKTMRSLTVSLKLIIAPNNIYFRLFKTIKIPWLRYRDFADISCYEVKLTPIYGIRHILPNPSEYETESIFPSSGGSWLLA